MLVTSSRFVRTTGIFCAVLAFGTACAAAAEIAVAEGTGPRAIAIEGRIEAGDFERFVQLIEEHEGTIADVYLFSRGGDFHEAMKIGRAMRALELSSHAPARRASDSPVCDGGVAPKTSANCTCASACFFMHIAGTQREGTYLGVHRPYFSGEEFGQLSQAEARTRFESLQDTAREYMAEMGVPKHVQDDVLGTPSERTLLLDEQTIETFFSGDLPYRHEWMRNRCSQPSQHEPGEKERQCAAEVGEQSRRVAYDRYFSAAAATDTASHRFSRWAEARRYLGERFDDLLAEEKFREDQVGAVSTLKRAATMNAPAVSLSESRPKARIVSSVTVVSDANPSKEFIQHLTRTLQGAWGRARGGNRRTEWMWSDGRFLATLRYHSTSAHGPYLHLAIAKR